MSPCLCPGIFETNVPNRRCLLSFWSGFLLKQCLYLPNFRKLNHDLRTPIHLSRHWGSTWTILGTPAIDKRLTFGEHKWNNTEGTTSKKNTVPIPKQIQQTSARNEETAVEITHKTLINICAADMERGTQQI